MSVVSALSRRRPKRASPTSIRAHLPHWSETAGEPHPPLPRPPPDMIEILRDLMSWAADVAIKLTADCPEDREAIERVREFVNAYLDGKPLSAVSTQDVLTTVAALMAEIDRNIDGTFPDEDERAAIGAPVTA